MSGLTPERLFDLASYACKTSIPDLNRHWLNDNERSIYGDPDLKRAIISVAKQDARFSHFLSTLEDDSKTIRVLNNNGWFLSCTFNISLIPLFLSSEDLAIREKFIKFAEARGGLNNLFFVHYVKEGIFNKVCMFRYESERVREFQIAQRSLIFNSAPYKSVVATASDTKFLFSNSRNEPNRPRST